MPPCTGCKITKLTFAKVTRCKVCKFKDGDRKSVTTVRFDILRLESMCFFLFMSKLKRDLTYVAKCIFKREELKFSIAWCHRWQSHTETLGPRQLIRTKTTTWIEDSIDPPLRCNTYRARRGRSRRRPPPQCWTPRSGRCRCRTCWGSRCRGWSRWPRHEAARPRPPSARWSCGGCRERRPVREPSANVWVLMSMMDIEWHFLFSRTVGYNTGVDWMWNVLCAPFILKGARGRLSLSVITGKFWSGKTVSPPKSNAVLFQLEMFYWGSKILTELPLHFPTLSQSVIVSKPVKLTPFKQDLHALILKCFAPCCV